MLLLVDSSYFWEHTIFVKPCNILFYQASNEQLNINLKK